MKREKALVELLRKEGLTLAVAESCTGGMLAAKIVGVPGVSEVFKAGFVTYANEAKEKLIGVKKETLMKHGAVSRKTAEEMATGAAKQAGTEVAISTTGIAGPGGGTEEKPVGLVYIGFYVNGKAWAAECHFTGSRTKIRKFATNAAITRLWQALLLYKREENTDE